MIPFVLHVTLRWIRSVYPIVVFCGYLMAFFVAFAFVFMLPIGALGVVFLSLMALIPVVIVWSALNLVERKLAARKLRDGTCPACGSGEAQRIEGEGEVGYSCRSCSARFTSRGEDIILPEPLPG